MSESRFTCCSRIATKFINFACYRQNRKYTIIKINQIAIRNSIWNQVQLWYYPIIHCRPWRDQSCCNTKHVLSPKAIETWHCPYGDHWMKAGSVHKDGARNVGKTRPYYLVASGYKHILSWHRRDAMALNLHTTTGCFCRSRMIRSVTTKACPTWAS